MNMLLCAGTVTLALLGSTGFAAAQKPDTPQADLTSNQQQMISQGLASSPSQPAPGGVQPQQATAKEALVGEASFECGRGVCALLAWACGAGATV